MEKTLRLSADQREDLVAYLDGELPDEKANEIDAILARSEVARHEVEALARAWELLDSLPAPKASDQFLERTMTTLQLKELRSTARFDPLLKKLKKVAIIGIWLSALGLSGWIGFQASNRWVPNPTERILEDLPLLQNFDTYQEIHSKEFLDLLKTRGLFDPPVDKDAQKD